MFFNICSIFGISSFFSSALKIPSFTVGGCILFLSIVTKHKNPISPLEAGMEANNTDTDLVP
jgi:hypothetical protein